jgi:hypothetical protein
VVELVEELESSDILPVGEENGIVESFLPKAEIEGSFQLSLKASKILLGLPEEPFP